MEATWGYTRADLLGHNGVSGGGDASGDVFADSEEGFIDLVDVGTGGVAESAVKEEEKKEEGQG